MASILKKQTNIDNRLCCFISLFVILALTSCTNVQNPSIIDQANRDQVGANQLAQAAAASNHSLQTMAETEQATLKPKTTIPPPLPKSYGLNQVVSIDWSGPIEPLIKQIAHMTGYHYRSIGRKPAIPVLVDVYARNEKVGNILRNAAYQADSRANVVLYPKRRLIELHYAKT